MSSKGNSFSIEAQSENEPGIYLFNAVSDQSVNDIKVNIYSLEVSGGLGYNVDREAFTSRAKYAFDRYHGIPVASAGQLEIAARGSLSRSVKVDNQQVTATKEGTRVLKAERKADAGIINQLVHSDLRRAIPETDYEFRFLNSVVATTPAFNQANHSFAGHHEFELSTSLTTDGKILLHVEAGHTIRSSDSIREMYNPGEPLPNKKVAHDTDVYDEPGDGWLQGWSKYRYSDDIPGMGGSIKEYHKGKLDEVLYEEFVEADPRLVKITYDGENTRYQLPHILYLSPRQDAIAQEDRDFNQLFQSKKAMMPDERAHLASGFVDDLSQLPTFETSFRWTPTNEGYEHASYRGRRSPLLFNGGHRANTPSEGLANHGVTEPVTDLRVSLLAPERFETLKSELPPLITKELRNLMCSGAVQTRTYSLGSEVDYSSVWQQLPAETSVALVVVPDKDKISDFSIEDPHDELKRTLMRKGIPTQMLQKSTVETILQKQSMGLASNQSLLNTLSALVAKAGGTPWKVADMPGETDVFMGLDVSYDSDTGQFTGASASMTLADGTTFAAESTTQQGGEKFEAKHIKEFLRDLVSDFSDSTDIEPSRIGLLRDGKVHEDIDIVRAGLEELDAELDVLGIRKSGQPRIGAFDGTSFKIAEKGHAFVSEGRDEAILHSWGKPEIRDDNSSGTPRTIKLVKHSGPTDIGTLAEQCYWLSEMHVGSPARSTRLPVPVKFADQAADYVSRGFASPGEVIRGPAFI